MAKSRLEIGVTRACLVLSLVVALVFVSIESSNSYTSSGELVWVFIVIALIGVASTYLIVWVLRGFSKKQ